MNFRYKLMQFLSGRYGIDSLFYVLFSVAMAIAVVNCFVGSVILQIFVYLLGIIAFFRAFSRNISARSRENRMVSDYISKIKSRISTQKQRAADKTHIYKKCPNCKAVLRLPRKKGKHTVNCPKCANSFKVRVFQ